MYNTIFTKMYHEEGHLRNSDTRTIVYESLASFPDESDGDLLWTMFL